MMTSSYLLAEDQLVLVHGFDRAMIAGLVDECLATVQRETVTEPGLATIEAIRFRISDAGRRVIEG